MGWNIGTKRGKKREERRQKRRENRKLRRSGPKKQYLGGSEDSYKGLSESAAKGVENADTRYQASADTLNSVTDRAARLETSATRDLSTNNHLESTSRSGLENSVNDLGAKTESVLAQRAMQLRMAPSIGQATDTAINQNNALAQQRLAQTIGLQNRAAMGLAAGQGEGGALAMQQAIASAGAGAADLTGQNNTEQAQLAAQMRYQAALEQNAQDVTSANLAADARLGAQQQELAGREALRQGDQNSVQLAANRQLSLLGQGAGNAQAGAALALDARGQQLQNQQFVEGTQLGIDVADAQAKYEAAKNKGLVGFLGRVANFGNTAKGAADSMDIGPTKKLLGGA